MVVMALVNLKLIAIGIQIHTFLLIITTLF